MIEPYQYLLANANKFGFKRDNIGPASVDLCLNEVKRFKFNRFIPLDIESRHNEHGVKEIYYRFAPSYFYLCSTEEYIYVPDTHCAFINMRSSLARKGLGHKMAGFIDPGFEGQVTLELSTDIPMTIMKGERIVQIIYQRLSEATIRPYLGKYLKQIGPTEAYRI